MIVVEGIIEKVETRKGDKTLKIVFGTQEIPNEKKAELFSLVDDYGFVAFSAVQIDKIEVPELAPEFKTDKTPSQQLRDVMYIYWEQNYKGKQGAPEWEMFYKTQMLKHVEYYKNKLN